MIFKGIKGFFSNTLLGRILGSFVFQIAVIQVVVFLSVYTIIATSITPERYDLKVGDIAPEDIIAPKDTINLPATRKLQEEAVKSVPKKFTQDSKITEEVMAEIKEIFQSVYVLKKESNRPESKILEELKEKIDIELTEEGYKTFFKTDPDDLKRLEEETLKITEEILEGGIKEDNLDKAKTLLIEGFRSVKLPKELKNLGEEIAISLLRPNMVFDRVATEQEQWEAINSVIPVKVLKNEIIVQKGHKITDEHLEILKDLDLLAQGRIINIKKITGISFLVITFQALVFIFLFLFYKDILFNKKLLILIYLIILSNLLIARGIFLISGYLIPVASGVILITIFVNPKVAMLINLVLGILIGIITRNDFHYTLVALVGGTVGMFSVSRLQQRSDLTRAGFMIAIANAVVILGIGCMENYTYLDVFRKGLWGIINGVFSVVLAIGLLPFIENAFGVTSAVKLIELSNPNQPLLKRLLVEAPGTYHHSIIVGNLAEAAAEAVGGNSLLARVGAAYHDIGKIKRPYFFIENQLTSENPHDKLTPSLSSLIITSHIKDGLELAKAYKLPGPVVDIIKQHHGTSLLTYFYHKAKEQDSSESVAESSFRYEGPKPKTKEAAIVMLADSVEAAIRSLSKPTAGRIEGLVREIIKDRLNDDQLNACDLTLKDLDNIAAIFSKILAGIFHSRIEYPKAIKEFERGKLKNGGTDNESTEYSGSN